MALFYANFGHVAFIVIVLPEPDSVTRVVNPTGGIFLLSFLSMKELMGGEVFGQLRDGVKWHAHSIF